jgi:hypothetical protein
MRSILQRIADFVQGLVEKFHSLERKIFLYIDGMNFHAP